MLQDIGQVRLASHSDVEPDDRRAGGTEHGRIRWLSPVVAPAIEFILEDSAWPWSESSTRWVLPSRTSTRLTSSANFTAFVSMSS